MILVIIASVVFLILSWLLLSPLIINVDTRIPVLEVRWKNIGSVSLIFISEKWLLKFRILFFSRVKSLNSLTSGKTAPKKKKIKSKKFKSKKSFAKIASGILRVIKSFRIRRFLLSIDTGDYSLNGILYSFYAFPAINKYVTVNFENRNYTMFQISNTPLRIILAYLNIHFLHFKNLRHGIQFRRHRSEAN